jgi:hypothetical protein
MIINRKKDIYFLKNIFSKIFISNDPFSKVFVSSISNKILLYPTEGYYLSEKQFSALNNTIKQFGETSYYLSEIEGQAFKGNDIDSIHPHQHLELDINTTYADYIEKNIIFENAFYSSSGKWGAIISHEDHAILGGSKEFITIFKKFYSNCKDDQKKFLEAIEYWGKLNNSDLSWLPDFLDYINSN